MTIWKLVTLIKQPELTSTIIQPNFKLIEEEKIDIISSLRNFTLETKETPTQWRDTTNILDEEDEQTDIEARRPL